MVLLLKLLDLDGLKREVFVLEAGTLLSTIAGYYLSKGVPGERFYLEELVVPRVSLAFACVHSLSLA